MMVGLAIATMVASTMIMKKPIIIAHNAFQGLSRFHRLRSRQCQPGTMVSHRLIPLNEHHYSGSGD